MRDGKFVPSEALFHLGQFIGRMLIVGQKKSVDSEVESEIERLVDWHIEIYKRTSSETI